VSRRPEGSAGLALWGKCERAPFLLLALPCAWKPILALKTWNRAAATLYGVVSAVVVAFQAALALGAPWGGYAMGGRFPGQLPPALRASAALSGLLIVLLVGIVFSRAALALPRRFRLSQIFIWVVVGFAAVALVLNIITPSVGERTFWAPTSFILLVSGLIVAITGPADP
jgi:hypothetical protein